MGFLDTVLGMLGSSSNKSDKNPSATDGIDIMEALKDGKIDINDVRDQMTDAFDQNHDGKLDASDLAGVAQDQLSKRR